MFICLCFNLPKGTTIKPIGNKKVKKYFAVNYFLLTFEHIKHVTDMRAKEFVKQTYPKAWAFAMIDNPRRQTSYVVMKGDGTSEYITNEGARSSSKAWTDAKKFILSQEKQTSNT